MSLPKPIIELRRLISKMPGFSERGAERFLEWWWRTSSFNNFSGQPRKEKEEFFENWGNFTKHNPCKKCFYFALDSLCDFCKDNEREKNKVCVVGSVFSVSLIDKGTEYRGNYFILDGDAVGSRSNKSVELVKKRIAFLKERIIDEKITELIIATDFTSAGEATALYIEDNLKECPVKISRLARGLHTGDSLGYSDPVTLRSAFENRK